MTFQLSAQETGLKELMSPFIENIPTTTTREGLSSKRDRDVQKLDDKPPQTEKSHVKRTSEGLYKTCTPGK